MVWAFSDTAYRFRNHYGINQGANCFAHMFLFGYKNWGLRGGKPHLFEERGWIAPLYLNMSSIFLLVTLMALLPSSIEGLMGLWEEHLVSLFPLKGTRLLDDSPREWFSEPLDCPPNEGCSPEPMVGTMNPLGGNPRPFQGGEEVR